MSVIESAEYGETRRRLAADPIVRAMAEGVRHEPRSRMAHDSGTPRGEFMLAALREYDRRAGHPANCHIGGVAEAILMVLDEAGPNG